MNFSSKSMEKIGPGTDLSFVRSLSSSSFGAHGRRELLIFLSKHGFQVGKKAGEGHYHAMINDKKVVIKISTIWKGGKSYVFQQIKDGDWDYLLCFGISSTEDNLWIMSREDIYTIPGQHTGMGAKETKWIHISPEEIKPDYLKGGTLGEGLEAIHDALD